MRKKEPESEQAEHPFVTAAGLPDEKKKDALDELIISDEEGERRMELMKEQNILERNPKLKILSSRLKDVARKFDALKKSGMDEEILIIFLSNRTGMGKNDVKNLLKAQDEFFSKLLRRSK